MKWGELVTISSLPGSDRTSLIAGNRSCFAPVARRLLASLAQMAGAIMSTMNPDLTGIEVVVVDVKPAGRPDLKAERLKLEAIIEPFITTEKTVDRILFRGRMCYFKRPSVESVQSRAVLALQDLYRLEAAMKAGKVNEAVQYALYFAFKYVELSSHSYFGMRTVDALQNALGQRQRAISAGRTRMPLTPKQRRKAVAEIKSLIRSGKSQKRACEMLAPKYGVSWRTLKRYDDSAE